VYLISKVSEIFGHKIFRKIGFFRKIRFFEYTKIFVCLLTADLLHRNLSGKGKKINWEKNVFAGRNNLCRPLKKSPSIIPVFVHSLIDPRRYSDFYVIPKQRP